MLLPILAITQVLYVWARSEYQIEAEINNSLVKLEESIGHNYQKLNVKDIKFSVCGDINKYYSAFIIYEIIDKSEKSIEPK